MCVVVRKTFVHLEASATNENECRRQSSAPPGMNRGGDAPVQATAAELNTDGYTKLVMGASLFTNPTRSFSSSECSESTISNRFSRCTTTDADSWASSIDRLPILEPKECFIRAQQWNEEGCQRELKQQENLALTPGMQARRLPARGDDERDLRVDPDLPRSASRL